jgi:hypothetical protein
MDVKTADGKHNFKTCLYFLILKLSPLSGILLTLSALHAIRRLPHAICSKGYLITFCNSSKGNQRPFCKLQEGIRLPHAILFDFRGFFGFCMRYLIPPFLQVAKKNLIPLRAGTKGGKKPFQISFCISLLHETILYL